MIRATAEAFGIFTASVTVLFLISVVLSGNTHKATGIGWVHWKGLVLMIVGLLYFAFGLVLTRVAR